MFIFLFIAILVSVIMICFPSYYFVLEPSLIFTITLEQVFSGIVAGLTLTAIGCILLSKSEKWKNSMSYIVGHGLTKGNIFILFLIALGAGIFEEFMIRGFLLSLYNLFHIMNLKFFLIIVFANLFWVLTHLFNRNKDFKINPVSTLNKSWPHLMVIFLSGIPFTYLALVYNSLTSPMIAHFILDFLFGLLYREYLKAIDILP